MSPTVLSQLRNLLKLFSLSTSGVELEMRFQLHLKSPRAIRLLWKLESMALEKWSCLRHASRENGFLWKETHLSTSSSSLKWVLTADILLVFSSKSLSIRLWFLIFNFCSHLFFLYQLTVMSVIAMTLFLRTEMHKNSVSEGGVYSGALFYSLALMMFIGMPEISMTIGSLPVFYKQRDLLFYPSWAYSLPSWILRIPVTLLQTTIWVALTYYVIGYDPDAGRWHKL